jgi:PAS domain S-box-containing protein
MKTQISDFNQDDWINLINMLRTECKIKGHQSWHRRSDGKLIHVVANLVGIFNSSGRLTQIKGYIFDDTDRKKAEEFLQASEEKYHRLFDEDLTGDFIATVDGEILECNPAFAEIYGFTNRDLASKCNISKFNSFDWPYMITRLKKEHRLQGFQSWQRRSDGMRIHIVANLVGIFNEPNELIQVKGYVFDDTDRKQAEEELARSKHQMTEILDSIQDGFIALSHYWHFIYSNRCASEYFKVEYEDLIGQNLWETFPELKGTIYEASFRKAMETQEIQHFEVNGLHYKDHCFEFTVYPSADGISVYWRNISARKKL